MLSLAVTLIAAPVKFELTIPSIMRGTALIGGASQSLRWSPDGQTVIFQWAKADGTQDPRFRTFSVNRDGTGLAPYTAPPTGEPPLRNPWDSGIKVNGKVAYAVSGEIFLYDEVTKDSIQLTTTPEREENPRVTSDGEAVIFTRENNHFRLNLADKAITQQTAFEPKDGVKTIITAPAGMNRGAILPSPSGTHVAVNFVKSATAGRVAEVPSYINQSGYSQMLRTYERVGASQFTSLTRIYDLRTGQHVEFAPPTEGRSSMFQWAPNGKHGIGWVTTNDYENAYLMGVDIENNKITEYHREYDHAWIGGPGRGLLAWLPDSSKFYFQSEETGFSNLYVMAPGDAKKTNLTPGKYEVSDLRYDAPRNRFLFVSSEGSPYKRHLAAVSPEGGAITKLAELSADDGSTYAMSPDGKEFAVVRSTSNRPPELFVNGKQITTTPTDEWLSGPWINPPIVEFAARDGAKVPAKLFKPKRWRKGGPAVIFIHGAGYLQNVFEGWSYYYREYMFHHILMDKGYAVLDVDYRASAGYGKAWRTAIYEHMGGADLNDILDGAQYLVKEVGADPKRLGVYGGSYGGFLTLMAMFNSPDTFLAGAALRPVTDWASYHHGYTAPILNTPQEAPHAYKRSSPIHFAEGLKGHLLICHGMVDVNVHFQDSVRLAQRLIELGKDNWEIAPYPVEDHAFRQPSSWTDEYKRIFNLFERTIGTQRRK